jgi:hypothetical protein
MTIIIYLCQGTSSDQHQWAIHRHIRERAINASSGLVRGGRSSEAGLSGTDRGSCSGAADGLAFLVLVMKRAVDQKGEHIAGAS